MGKDNLANEADEEYYRSWIRTLEKRLGISGEDSRRNLERHHSSIKEYYRSLEKTNYLLGPGASPGGEYPDNPKSYKVEPRSTDSPASLGERVVATLVWGPILLGLIFGIGTCVYSSGKHIYKSFKEEKIQKSESRLEELSKQEKIYEININKDVRR